MSGARPSLGARLPIAAGFLAVFLLVGGLGTWSVGTQIAGAVIAPGTVRVESESQVIQHPDGGVVGTILARNGDEVAAGDVLVQLDDTFLRSELGIVERQLGEIFARKIRLQAEQDGADDFVTPPPPDFALFGTDWISEQIEGQKRLFIARRVALEQEVRQLAEQEQQIEIQIQGTEAQIKAFSEQSDLIAKELGNVEELFGKGLVQSARLLELKRERARLTGEIGRLTASVAEARTRISGIEIEILRLSERSREDAIEQLRDLSYAEIELEQRRLSLTERLSRLDVRAPVAGKIFNSKVFAVRSVVQAAEPMMYVVPGDQPLEVSARIDPTQIDQVFVGQPVMLRLTSFDSRTTPEVPGSVIRISADVETDRNTGATYYEAVVRPDADALADIEDATLVPGMPVETFLRTRDRSPLEYLIHPLAVYFGRAFRED